MKITKISATTHTTIITHPGDSLTIQRLVMTQEPGASDAVILVSSRTKNFFTSKVTPKELRAFVELMQAALTVLEPLGPLEPESPDTRPKVASKDFPIAG